MFLSSFHDLINYNNIFQICLSDQEIANLPPWLRPPPNDCSLVTQLRYLTEVAKYLTDLEEEIEMTRMLEIDDELELQATAEESEIDEVEVEEPVEIDDAIDDLPDGPDTNIEDEPIEEEQPDEEEQPEENETEVCDDFVEEE